MIAAYWALSGIIGVYLAQALGNLGSSTRFHREFLNYQILYSWSRLLNTPFWMKHKIDKPERARMRPSQLPIMKYNLRPLHYILDI